ncbi:MAG: flavin reductase [Muribaculaceae bacterium]|nr:flavin reductase [Muribaculaceae bacterium]
MKRLIQAMMIALIALAPATMSAQTEHGFKAMAVEQDFTENGFNWFRHALLLAAGNEQQSNAMTIGWGDIGTLWRKTAVTVYVAEKRYTKQFMDNAQYFTVMAFTDRKEEILEYMGTKSGRDGDKAKALNLHTAYTQNGTPYYIEADMVIECRTMYAAPFDPQYFRDEVPRNMYAHFPAGFHTMYIGEVVGAWKK